MSLEPEGLTRAEGGVVRLVPAVTQWSWSPDDAHLAVALADPDGAGRSVLAVIEADTGRAVMRVAGREVMGLGWASPEHLVVTRAQDVGSRAVLHAVPDGAVLGSLALPGLHEVRHSVVTSEARGGVSSVALVTPARWQGGTSARAPFRAGYALRIEPFEVAREIRPERWRALPSTPSLRPAALALEPDGAHALFWLGEPAPAGGSGGDGHLLRYAWEDDRAERVCRAGARVAEVICCDPTRALLRESAGDDPAARGDITLVDLDGGSRLSTTADEDDRVGPWASVDLHPDRERALVCGRPLGEAGGALRAFDVVAGRAEGAPAVVPRLAGAVWRGEGDGVWALSTTSRAATLSALASPRGGVDDGAGRWRFPLEGKTPSRIRLAWSPGRTRLTAAWRCVPSRADAALRALGVGRLAWVDRPG